MKIIINRDSGYADCLRAYHIILDEKDIGEIKQGQTLKFDVQEGTHQLYLRIDHTGSNKVDFSIKDQDVKFVCKSNLRGFKLLFTLFFLAESFINSNNWITLEKVD